MSVKHSVQLGLAFFLLMFSTIAAWYEGSELLNNPWEWEYSTPFSHLFNQQVEISSDISQLDFFIYSGKFTPIFPVLMIISLMYLVNVSVYLMVKRNLKHFSLFLAVKGILLLMLIGSVSESPTIGGGIFTITFLISGTVCLAVALVFYFELFKRTKSENYS
ncbi:DUF4306 domain-containing protein [Aquibacillus halophilus]|uniref:DUF4306 domain-containing protein n=1 Tax=Aquibacillus halophilus TaxID=930132 RepID=A0A6A8DKG5_9BACI|nr:YjdJ family protein [Aquibacillus halophilus]MRH43477.1 DUF4306 domain-containing protein [Aquibacillus halophilus]